VGGAYGGLWRSQNAASGSFGNVSGVTWTPLTDDQPTLAVGSVALQPGNTNSNTHLSRTILVGTGEANDAADSYYGLGILRSTDEGQTWSLITSADGGAHPFSVRTSATQQFTVTMSPANSPVSWDVNGTRGGDSTTGTISSLGLSRAPGNLPSVPVVVRASAQADPSKAAAARVVVQAVTPVGAYGVTVTATEGSGGASLSRLLTIHLTVQ
jgi:hypothetical protein